MLTALLHALAPVLVPALLLGAAAGVALASPGRAARLDDVLPRGVGSQAPFAPLPPVGASRLACLVGGLALALLVTAPVGLVLGAAVALAGPRALARLEPQADRREREQLSRDLPLALDLLAACLAGGAPLPRAVAVVAEAVPGPCGARLSRVAAALQVGSPPAEAWAALLEGEDPAAPVAAPAVRALVRSSEGGAPVAAAVARAASDSRLEARAASERAARRAGVLAVAPLGLCFLPAFVLLGVVPVVVGLAGPLLASL